MFVLAGSSALAAPPAPQPLPTDPAVDALHDYREPPEGANSTTPYGYATTLCSSYHSEGTDEWIECVNFVELAIASSSGDRATVEALQLMARRLGLITGQLAEGVRLDDETIDALTATTPLVLSASTVDDLADAIASATPSGPGGPGGLEPDEQIGVLVGLVTGLWVMTRIYRLVVPDG